MSLWKAYRDDILFSFRKHKQLAEQAFGQVKSDADFFHKPGPHSNSIAIIIKHIAGNLASRWTDFLTTDGDKPWRDRDAEFVIGPEDTRPHLILGGRVGRPFANPGQPGRRGSDETHHDPERGAHRPSGYPSLPDAYGLPHRADRLPGPAADDRGLGVDHHPSWAEPTV